MTGAHSLFAQMNEGDLWSLCDVKLEKYPRQSFQLFTKFTLNRIEKFMSLKGEIGDNLVGMVRAAVQQMVQFQHQWVADVSL